MADSATSRNEPQRLNAQQLRAVDLLASGLTDSETADAVGVDRATVWRWRTRNPWFEAALNSRREEVWGAARDRLRSLVPLALDALEQELTSGGAYRSRTALELLKLVGSEGLRPDVGPTDADSIIEARARAKRTTLNDLLHPDGGPPTREERDAVVREALADEAVDAASRSAPP